MTYALSLCFSGLVHYCCAGHCLFLLKQEPVTVALANFAAVAEAVPSFLWRRDWLSLSWLQVFAVFGCWLAGLYPCRLAPWIGSLLQAL